MEAIHNSDVKRPQPEFIKQAVIASFCGIVVALSIAIVIMVLVFALANNPRTKFLR